MEQDSFHENAAAHGLGIGVTHIAEGSLRRATAAKGQTDLPRLARGALKGAPSAQARFLEACRRHACQVAVRIGGTHFEAEDCAQDALVAVHGLLNALPPRLRPDTVGAFVAVVVRRALRAMVRRRTREALAVRRTSGRSEVPDTRRSVELEELTLLVRAAVARLEQPLRRVVALRYWDDLSCREIARAIGTSHTSVIRLLRTAETALRTEVRHSGAM